MLIDSNSAASLFGNFSKAFKASNLVVEPSAFKASDSNRKKFEGIEIQDEYSPSTVTGPESGVYSSKLAVQALPEKEVEEKEDVSIKLQSNVKQSFSAMNPEQLRGNDRFAKMMQELNKTMLTSTITRTLEKSGVELKEGDILSVSVNGKGVLSINSDTSMIGDKSGKEIKELCDQIAGELNEVSDEDGTSLGDALLAQFAAEKGLDLDSIKGDENFSISFAITYNPKKERNEIGTAVIKQLKENADTEKPEITGNASEKTVEKSAQEKGEEALEAFRAKLMEGVVAEILIPGKDGQARTIRTGDTGLSESEQRAIDAATWSAAQNRWAENARPGSNDGTLRAQNYVDE